MLKILFIEDDPTSIQTLIDELHEKYTDIIHDIKEFEEARKRIKEGRHIPDFEENEHD